MGTIWIKEFIGGLDTRKLSETTPGGVLIRATNGHITRGGEFEKRAAFVAAYELLAGTVGLANTPDGLVVFGSGASPAMPAGVSYQRLQHPDLVTGLVRVASFDLYAGKLYVAGVFADGSVHHFYDGNRVVNWFDGRARATFTVVSGDVTGSVDAITVAGVDALGVAVGWQGTVEATAVALVNQINAYVSAPDYTAVNEGAVVSIVSVVDGAAANGRPVGFSITGALVVSPASGLALSRGADPQNQAGAAAAISQFSVTGSSPGVEATMRVTVASTASAESITALTVNGVALIPGTQNYPGSDSSADIATSLAGVIAGFSATSGYTAAPDGNDVVVTGVMRGATANGATAASSTTGGLTLTPTVFAGGSDGGRLYDLKIGGVSVIGAPIEGNVDTGAMAAAIASAITSYNSTPDYTAVAVANALTISAADAGSAANGRQLAFTLGGGLTFSPTFPPAMNNGSDAATGTFQPGDFVKTIGTKMYSTSGPSTHFSGIKQPTQWTTDATGAGFVDMSSEASGSEQLTALAKYQNLVAVFAERTIQTWYFDPDPTLNKQSQVLNNTGTASPRSVTQFGDNDLFYCDESGVRSLRARDSSNSAATSDIGVAIDSLILADLEGLTFDERDDIIGVIEQRDGRFWLAIHGTIYVFSFFGDGKVSAWSTYETGFTVEQMIPFRRKVYIRSGNTIYVYGGLGATLTYDDTEAEAWLPYLDGNAPAQLKHWGGIDAAVRGSWEIRAGLSPTDVAASDKIATIWQSSYNHLRIPMTGASSHISLRFTSKGSGPATIGAALLHFLGDADED